LVFGYPSQKPFSFKQNAVVQVVSAFAIVVGYLVYLADDLAEFSPRAEVIFTRYQNFTLHLLSNLNRSQTFFSVNGFGDETTSLDLNAHEFQDVKFFEGAPTYIKLIEVLLDLVGAGLNHDVIRFLSDFAVEIPQAVLQFEELNHQSAPMVQHLLRKRILLAIDPKIGKS
jgi:hypothetical protein